MALDLDAIPSEVRAAFIKDGARFGSEDTLAQANQTLNALALHGAKLSDYGFGAADVEELQDARDALITAGVGREAKRTHKKIDTVAHAAAVRDAQGTRLRARAVLKGAKRNLTLAGKTEAVQKIEVVLNRDSEAADDTEHLAQQLDALQALFKDSVVYGVAKNRGGSKVIPELEIHAAALRDAAKTKAEPRGTPVETEKLDLLDGIIVSLARLAREAADAAARDLGEPALETAFELSAIYKKRAKKAETPAPPEAGNAGGG